MYNEGDKIEIKEGVSRFCHKRSQAEEGAKLFDLHVIEREIDDILS